MPLTRRNVKESVMTGVSRYSRFMRKYKENFEQPDVRTYIRGALNNMPPEYLESLQQRNPALFRKVEEMRG